MKPLLLGASLALALIAPAFAADAQSSARMRGTITAFDKKILAVKSVDGRDVKLQLADSTSVVYPKAIALADLRPGEYVGITSTRNAEGKLVAREVHTIPPGASEGHRPLAQDPVSTMTNANIARSVKSTNGHELTLEYKGGAQTLLVPEGTPVTTTVAADRSMLVPGAYVIITAMVASDGTMTAQRIQASKDGIKPSE